MYLSGVLVESDLHKSIAPHLPEYQLQLNPASCPILPYVHLPYKSPDNDCNLTHNENNAKMNSPYPVCRRDRISILDLLSMRAGLQWDEWCVPLTSP